MISRRSFLATLSVGAGGVGAWHFWGPEEDSTGSKAETEASQDDTGNNEDGSGDASDDTTSDNSDSGESNEESSEAGPEDTENESNTTGEADEGGDEEQEQEQEEREEDPRQHEPTEEETAVNSEEYDQPPDKEVEARPASDIDDSVTSKKHGDGSISVEGEITNASSEDIDMVDIEVSALTEDDEVLKTKLVAFEDGLAAGETKTYSVVFSAYDTPGVVSGVHVDIYPMDEVEA